MQGVSKTDFENYVKANDAVLRNSRRFMARHVNAITTRSGKTCEGPSTLVPTPVVSTPLKEPEQNPETSMDKFREAEDGENCLSMLLYKELDRTNALRPILELGYILFALLSISNWAGALTPPNDTGAWRPFLRTAKALIESIEENYFKMASTTIIQMSLPPRFLGEECDYLEELSMNLTLLKKSMDEDVVNKNSNVLDEPVLLNTPLTDKVECPNPEDDIDEIDAFLAIDDTTHNFAPEVISDHEPEQNESSITFSPRNFFNFQVLSNDDSEDEDNGVTNLDHQRQSIHLLVLHGTDKTKITRKPSKKGKHGHEEWKSTKEARDAKPKAGKDKKSKLWSTLGQHGSTKSNHVSLKILSRTMEVRSLY
ncbi:hypothetical protein Tco_0153899 [Tanacetum coccineum]